MTAAVEKDRISECVILCTCSRTELFFCGDNGAEEIAVSLLAEHSGASRDNVMRYAMIFCGRQAKVHLFRVACGIESMVVGEDEILGQTRNAYKAACENGTVSAELNMIFQAALACAKRIKTDTELSRLSVSTATLAANEAARLGSSVNVVVIGASGKIGQTTVKNLLSHKNVKLTATLRQHTPEIVGEWSGGIGTALYSERYSLMDAADCVISATSGPHFTVTRGELEKHIFTPKNRLFIDLAVPRDIDRDIENIDGVRLLGIDDFEKLAEEHNALKADGAEAAKALIEEEIEALEKNTAVRSFLPCCDIVIEAISRKGLEGLIYKMKSELTSEQLAAALKAMADFGKE